MHEMNLVLLIGLLAACGILMVLERLGVPTTLQLSFKGDVKRETQWLAQYGQAVATLAAAALIFQLDPSRRHAIIPLIAAVSAASVSAFVIKRLVGRVRPNREHAGRFLGPSLRHANHRESFPSSHSACAVALTVALAHFYPAAAITFWTLALITAALRYVLDAHWPSDVVGGIALGYAAAWAVLKAFGV
ncbi:phosphatase PAP2 family protein [Fontivita pretiosa]|uniref:phosphatase PAP2 family protein n=1 Tax=Fontivita pretiosa TaxID=2989684 RepID=UPI003D16DE6E